MLVYYFVPFIVSNRYLLFWVSNAHNSVTVQNRTHVYMIFFYHKDLGNHLLQLCPKVVKHPVYEFKTGRRLNSSLLRLSLDHRASSEDPRFATTVFVTNTSLVNCYDLNAQLCKSICSRKNNPTLQVDDKIRGISAAFTCGLIVFWRPVNCTYYTATWVSE